MKSPSFIFILTSLLLFSGCTQATTPTTPAPPPSTAPASPDTDITNTDRLKAAVFAFANKKTAGDWSKEYTITAIHETNQAALGTWKKNQHYNWIAYKKTNGDWQVLLALPRFMCSETKLIPSEFKNFFKDPLALSGCE